MIPSSWIFQDTPGRVKWRCERIEREREKWGKKWYAVGRKWWLGILSPVTRTRPRVRARGRSRSSRKGEPIGAENTLRDTGWPFFTLRSALHPRRSTLLFANQPLQLTLLLFLFTLPISRKLSSLHFSSYPSIICLLLIISSINIIHCISLLIPSKIII